VNAPGGVYFKVEFEPVTKQSNAYRKALQQSARRLWKEKMDGLLRTVRLLPRKRTKGDNQLRRAFNKDIGRGAEEDGGASQKKMKKTGR